MPHGLTLWLQRLLLIVYNDLRTEVDTSLSDVSLFALFALVCRWVEASFDTYEEKIEATFTLQVLLLNSDLFQIFFLCMEIFLCRVACSPCACVYSSLPHSTQICTIGCLQDLSRSDYCGSHGGGGWEWLHTAFACSVNIALDTFIQL